MRSHLSNLLSFFCVLLFSGCTTNHPITDPLSVAPNDFSLDITIAATEPHHLAHLNSSRFVVFPNGALHHGDEEGWGPNTLPARTRILSREQIAKIWILLDEVGMSNPENADQTVNFQILPKPKEGLVYMIAINAHGKYWNYVNYISDEKTIEPKYIKLIRLLAKYSWVSEEESNN